MNYQGYLFAYFTGENTPKGEQIYFALSEDGLHWQDCQEPESPILTTKLGEQGARDPFLVRDRQGMYHLIATDLRIASGRGWSQAVTTGSRSLLLWHSEDLIHWSEAELVELAIPSAGCLWAPEAIYDEKREDYMIFFASNVQEAGESEPKQRIYYTRTKDFKQFSKTEKYIERENHVIDTTIAEYQGKYYRFSKNETTKHVDMDVSEDLLGEFTPVVSKTLASLEGVEGPEIYPLPEEGTWCLIVDRFAEGTGYLPLVTKDLASGDFQILADSDFDMGKSRKRHGGVLALTKEEYDRLVQYFIK